MARLFFILMSLCTNIGLVSAQSTTTEQNTPSNPSNSIVALAAEVPIDELSRWLSQTMPTQFSGNGSEKICQRVLGIKICGTATWQYQVHRVANVELKNGLANNAGLTMNFPLIVDGVVGVEGDVARALGMNSVPIAAELDLRINTDVLANAQGCPLVNVSAQPRWIDKPTAVLPGNIKIRLTEALEDALAEQMSRVQKELNQFLDCDLIFAHLDPLWSLCYADASRQDTGPGLWALQPRKIHWSLQSSRSNQNLALVVGVDANVNLQLGLRATDVESQLLQSNCTTQWARMQQPLGSNKGAASKEQSGTKRLVFDANMVANSSQKLLLTITHESLVEFAESNYAGRNLGRDDSGNEVVLNTITLLPKDSNATATTTMTLESQFDAVVPVADGVVGWFQKKLRLATKSLSGVMRIDAKPVWNYDARVLTFENLVAKVTRLEPGAKLSLDNAVFALMQRHVQKTLAENSSVELGNAIDGLSNKLNTAIDARVRDELASVGGTWRPNTASININDIVAAGQGITLDAQLNANWLIRFRPIQWPTNLINGAGF